MGKKEEIPDDPRVCPPELKAIIESCWETSPKKRPTANQTVEKLKLLVTTEKSELKTAPVTPIPEKNTHEREMQQLKAKMEQLKLAHEEQLAAAAEKEQRLEAEKQQREKEMERLKQQHQAELKRNQEKTELKLPSQTPITPTKTMPIPAVSQIIPHTLMPSPKPKASAEQLKLQDQLITACKQGDEKAVTALFKRERKAGHSRRQR